MKPVKLHAIAKLDALEKAVAGDILTPEEEEALRECIVDCKRRIKLGNGFTLTTADVIEAFEILFDDVNFMTARRRQRAIRLLIKAGAKGYSLTEIPIPVEHPTDEPGAEGFRVPVTDEEKLEVLLEAS